MNRNPIIPFVLIMVIGVAAMFLMSFKGLGDAEEIAAEKDGGGQKTADAASPEDTYASTCAGCHGGDFKGVSGPKLLGVGDKYSQDELVDILTNGKTGNIGQMPGGLIPGQEKAMAEWLATLK